MTFRRLTLLWLTLFALLAAPVPARDDVDDDEEAAPAPPAPRPMPPPPPPPRPAPPPERVVPPPEPPRYVPPPPVEPPRPRVMAEYAPRGFYFAPELLALQFDDGELEYGTDMTDGSTLSVDDGDLDLGWRLGLGYRWRNHWDFVVRGTDVGSSERARSVANGPAGIATTFAGGLDTAEAELDIDYTTIDAEAGYTWGAWERSHARLSFGPRFASIDQEFSTSYDPDTTIGGDGLATRERQDMDAFGLHVGLEGTIAFNRQWALILQAGAGLYDASFDNDAQRTAADGTVVTARSSADDDDTVTSLDASLAFRWQRRAFEDGMFGIRFGWEAVQWNDVPTPADVASTSGPHFRDRDFAANGPFFRFEWIF